MVLFLIIMFALLLILNLIISKNNIFSPGVITTVLWIFCLLLFLILKHNLPPLTGQFIGALSLWVFLYVFSVLLMQSTSTSDKFNYEPSKTIRDLYFWISVFTFPLLLKFVYEAIKMGNTGNWALDLRIASLETTNKSNVFGGIYFVIWQVSYVLELFYYSKKNKYKVFILAIFLIFFAFASMAKALLLEFFLITIFILYMKKIVSLKHLLIGLTALFFLFVTLQTIRHHHSVNKNDFMVLYVIGNMSSFDILVPSSAEHWGENTFRFFYATAHSLGLSDSEPVSIFQPWIKKPLETNTYTAMYPYFKDFGYWGVGIFAIVLGTLFGWIFKKAQKGNAFFICLFASLVHIVVMQYVVDLFFTMLSGRIKYAIILIIPFLVAKYKLFAIKHKT